MSEQSTLQGSASFKDSSLDSIKIEKFAKILMISLEKMRDLKNRGTNTSMKRQYLKCRKFHLVHKKCSKSRNKYPTDKGRPGV